MPAIKVHHTATDTESDWDGPAEVAEAPNDAKILRYMHAWEDGEGDPEAKSTYKFPHHAAGDDTPANINGVNNALARLPQANIPEADRAGVEAHLRAHRVDAGLEEEDSVMDRVRTHAPIRCFEGAARPHEAFWRWRNATENSVEAEPEMELYGYISEYSWFDDDITPKMFKDDLYRFGNSGPITIRMNSYGGDVIAASVMKSILIDYPGKVTVKIDGLAASAATIVAIAGDLVKIQESAYFMIHDPLVAFLFAVLNVEDLSRLLDELKTAKAGIIDGYQTKTGLSRERLARMMTDETWMTGREAVNLGFADELVTAKDKATKAVKAEVRNAAIINALHTFRNVPADLLKKLRQTDVQTQLAAERLRAEVKLLVKE